MSRQIPSNHENNVGSALAARGIDVMARLRDGTYEELMCPPEWTKALKKRVKSLPKTNMVWIVDCVNQNTPKTVDLLCTVAMVLKEEGSNGKPWLFYGQNQGEKCDGLGSPALAFTGVTLKRDKANLTAQVDVVLRSLAKACLEPVRATLAPKKPKKVLFTKDAILQGAAVTLRSLGIKEVGIADKMLIASMRADDYNKHFVGEMLDRTLQDSTATDGDFCRHIGKQQCQRIRR